MPDKQCSKCLQTLPSKCFYKDRNKADGLATRCKSCCDAQKKIYIAEHRDAYLLQHKLYRETHREQCRAGQKRWRKANPDKLKAQQEASRERRREVKRAWDIKNREHNRFKTMLRHLESPEKIKARRLVGYAVKIGSLLKQPCQKCGNLRVHAHHEDYSKPLEVVWLCNACHNTLHKASTE